MQRPISLTIVGWFLIVMSVVSLISEIATQDSPMVQQVLAESSLPAWLHQVMGLVGAFVGAVGGFGILKGFNWSRFLYVGWSAIALLIGFLSWPFAMMMVISLLYQAVIAFFLFRPAAATWFAARSAEASE